MAATVSGAIAALLAADAGVLAAVAADCIVSLEEGAAPISPEATPDLYERRSGSGVPVLKPCLTIGISTNVPVPATGIHWQYFARITAYAEKNYATTGAILEAVWMCLDGGTDDGVTMQLDDGRTVSTRFVDEPIRQSLDQSVVAAGAVKGAAMEQGRYRVDVRAKGIDL